MFVIQGDLTILACDAVVLPCDEDGDVNGLWRDLLPEGLPRGKDPSWLRVPLDQEQTGLVDEGQLVVLAVTVRGVPTVLDIVEGIERGLRRAGSLVERHDGRDKPLLALPLPGVGAGGLAGRRGEIAASVLEALRRVSRDLDVDVALVLWSSRDLAAVETLRASTWFDELDEHLLAEADHLGRLAARGELSLFLGAGLSVPLGLPSWSELLDLLAERAGMLRDPSASNDAEALRLVAALGDGYSSFMGALFRQERFALGHALISRLSVRQMVTTNFDVAMETALRRPPRPLRVLTDELSEGAVPFLLKLHGPFGEPPEYVLTEAEYEVLDRDHGALHGVVEALLLTSHLLFVGAGLHDVDLVPLLERVQAVRRLAKVDELGPAGTALALHDQALAKVPPPDELRVLTLGRATAERAAARRLEIFLDRLAYTASREGQLSAEYFLDPQYRGAFPEPADAELRESLLAVAGNASVRGSVAWGRVAELLTSLGWAGAQQ